MKRPATAPASASPPPTPAKLRALKDLRDRQGDRLVVISDFLDDPAIAPVTDTSPARDE